MSRQERAERTRRAVLAAAAREFADHGFAGTSLSRICGAAGVTMGAVTFHFATKAELADAVQEWGVELTCAALRVGSGASPGASAGSEPNSVAEEGSSAAAGSGAGLAPEPAPNSRAASTLSDVAVFTHTLARLLQDEVGVRAAARLAWDRPGSRGWYGTWLPLLRGLVERADGELAAWASPQAVTALALSVVAGAETVVRLAEMPGTETELAPARQAALVWELALSGRPGERAS